MSNNLMSTLLALGVLQGIIMGLALWFSIGKRNGTRFLAVAILAFALSLLRLWSHHAGLWDNHMFRRIPLAFDLAILPLFYLYALALTGANKTIIRRNYYWLLPWALFMVYSVAVYIASFNQPTLELKDLMSRAWRFGQVKTVEDYVTIVINTVLGLLIWLRVNRYYRRIANWLPEHQAAWVNTLRLLMALLLAAMLINILSFVAGHLLGHSDTSLIRRATYLFYVILVYVLSFLGFRLADLPRFSGAAEAIALDDSIPAKDRSPAMARLDRLMQEDQLYTNPNLNLNDLAAQLELSAAQTTQLIKTTTGKNFRGYVNEFRLKAIKQKLQDPNNQRFSVLALALESGFNSESSFYRLFKASTGISPTQYRQQASTETLAS